MATLPSTPTKTLTITSSSLYISSFPSSTNPPPNAFSLLSRSLPLPPPPPDLPPSKLIPNTRFVVDGFRPSSAAGDFSVSYFLSHFHSDHYSGLGPGWSRGLVFCSEITSRLLVEALGVPAPLVVPIAVGETVVIDGCDVTLVDANHCPGAVQFLFRVPLKDGLFERYVHTGDFRFCDSMRSDPFLCGFVSADAVFLDTTYCNPKFVFPSQEESIEYIIRTIGRIRSENGDSVERRVLFLIATYVIGKERILVEISRRFNSLLLVDERKMVILRVLGFGESGIFTEDASMSDVHVIGWNVLGETWPYFRPNFVKLKEIMMERGYSRVVGFVPTGWTYEARRDGFSVRTKDLMEIHLVPYSEHSSYDELREYVRFLKPKQVIPTVGYDIEKLDSKHADAMRKHFAGLVDETANKRKFLMGFQRRSEGDNDLIDGDDLNVESEIVPEMLSETVGEPDQLCCLDTSYAAPDDKEVDEKLQELRECLPAWVSRDQMLSLLSSCGGDIVAAVSEFYENETELYEKADTCAASVAPPPMSSLSSSSLCENESITNDASQAHDLSITMEEQCLTTDHVLADGIEAFTEEVEQFLQIINGGISRIDASSLMNEAKGDINRALNIYYNTNGVSRTEMPDNAVEFLCIETSQIQDISGCSSDNRSNISEGKENELNIGGSLVTAALEEACGTSRSKIREMYNRLGDLGDVAQECRQTQSLLAPPRPLTIRELYSTLQKISKAAGSGSTIQKKILVVNLMRSCREKEMKFLVRTFVRNMRIGAMMKTILPALAQAVVMNNSLHANYGKAMEGLKVQLRGMSAAVVEAYNVLPNLDILVPSLLSKGIEFSPTTLSMVPGIPIKPMLAKITNGVPQALELYQGRAFTCEYKYDGQRAQIHRLADGSIRVFSRNGEETTSRFPDLVNIIKELCKPEAMTFIMDAEVVAVDRKLGSKIMSFQELSSRERGSKDSTINIGRIKVEICIFVFDVMFANGEQLLALPLRQRKKYLKNLIIEKRGYLEYAKEITVEADETYLSNEGTVAMLNSFLQESFSSSCEGIMVKSLDVDAGYAASKRTDTWLKVKRDYVEELNDTLDLVPIGAWYGNGRKAGWYSPFLMACYNPETEEFQSVCRVMSGFCDSFYTEMKEFFSSDKILVKKPLYYRTSEEPELWFSPELVWQIRGADFTLSPVHQAAIGSVHPSRGISIRFPRFVLSVSDRKPEDCSTTADLVDMFHSQTRKMAVNKKD
ncbi:DNA ligase 1 [Acorus gramineus]|uniref:DNA ligase n=1 Tax=Acorus gramineus TaxID=55184 RepID=A0AAV9BXC9_ACOGR|nr:DNA ligase 1 [Acorus gramineus]